VAAPPLDEAHHRVDSNAAWVAIPTFYSGSSCDAISINIIFSNNGRGMVDHSTSDLYDKTLLGSADGSIET
jgi:hypothetical protein